MGGRSSGLRFVVALAISVCFGGMTASLPVAVAAHPLSLVGQSGGPTALTQTATTTALTSSVNPSEVGQQVTYSATVSPVPDGGSISFQDGTNVISGGSANFSLGYQATCRALVPNFGFPCTLTGGATGPAGNPGQAAASLSPGVGSPGTITNLSCGSWHMEFGACVRRIGDPATTAWSFDTYLVCPFGGISANFVYGDGHVLVQWGCAHCTPSDQTGCNQDYADNGNVFYTVEEKLPSSLPPASPDDCTSLTFDTSQGTASCTVAYSQSGSHCVTAVYGGDPNFASSSSSPVCQTVNLGGSATSLASSANPSARGQSVTYTATVAALPPASGTPTGSVAFSDGGVQIAGCGAQSLAIIGGVATASCTVVYPDAGSHTVTATYGGDASFSGSTSAPLDQAVSPTATLTALTSSSNPAVVGGTVTYNASITPTPDGGSVAFTDNGIPIGGCTALGAAGGTAQCIVTYAAVGSHNIVATYGGDQNFAASSGNLTQTVTQASTITAVTSTPDPSNPGQSVTFTATVTVLLPGSGTPTGSVTFYDGAVILGTVALNAASPDDAVLTTTALTVAGAHSITAVYAGDANFGGSTSSVLIQTVNPPSVTFKVPTGLADPLIAYFTMAVHGVTGANLGLRITGATGNLSAVLTCYSAPSVVVNCSTGPLLGATIRTASHLTPGQYYTAVAGPAAVSPISDAYGNSVPMTTRSFRASTFEQETSLAGTPAWQTVNNACALGGSYVQEHLMGATAAYQFTGTDITWYAPDGPQFGAANVYIDGVLKGTFSQYAPTQGCSDLARTFSGLPAGSHVLTILVSGSGAGSDTNVGVDGFKVGGTVDMTPALVYTWAERSNSSCFGGAFSVADEAGASSSFTFHGTSITWFTITGPTQGAADVYIDGVLVGTVSNYASAYHFKVARTLKSLANADHTVRLVVSSSRPTGSTGSFIVVDAWAVG